ncbi:MAG: PepSY domain-containing protein [Kofleriaceae bacterium]
MKRALLCFVLLVAALPTLVSRHAQADSDRPPVSIVQARTIALARAPGTIVNEKLKKKKEKEKRPRTWSIKIRPRDVAADSDRLVKVEIHAETGEVLKVKEVKARKADDD